MPTLRGKSVSAIALKRGFKAEAERKSIQYREELRLKKYDPLPASQLAEHLGIKILTPNEIPGIDAALLEVLLNKGKDCWSAAIFQGTEKKYIIHNPTHSEHRQESNLMHEIAHAICDHELKELESVLMGCVIQLRKYDQVQEKEAECLGSCLQLPQSALFHYYHIRKKTEMEISEIFNASMIMVRYRLSISGVTRINYSK